MSSVKEGSSQDEGNFAIFFHFENNKIGRKGLRVLRDSFAYKEYDIRLMLTPRLAKALQDKVLKLHEIKKLPRFVFMLRKGTDFSEESVEKSWGKESANESGSKFIPRFNSSVVEFFQPCFCLSNRTMKELLQDPSKGYGEAIVIPEILVENFEIKTNLLQFVQANKFHGRENDNPHMHVSNFKRLTVTLKYRDVPNDAIKLMLFPYSLEDRARILYEKEPPNSILTWEDLDSLNAASGGNLLNKTTREALQIIENKSKVLYSRSRTNIARVNTNSRDIEQNLRRNLNDDMRNILSSFFQNQPSTSGTLPSNTIPNPKGEMKDVTTRSGLAYEGPSIPTESSLEKVDEQNTEEILDKEHSNSSGSTAQIQPLVVPISIPEPDVSRIQPKPSISYPSRLNDQNLQEKATNQMEKFFQIFHDSHFDISFADALLLMPKFASTIKSLLANKDKLFELAKVSLNENCSAMLLKKLPEKLGDPGKFLIPCDFPGMKICHALADLGASINLKPLSIWKKLSLPELTPTRMTLELADRSIAHPKGVAEDVFVKVGKFHFLTDFVVVDFEADPRVPLILGRIEGMGHVGQGANAHGWLRGAFWHYSGGGEYTGVGVGKMVALGGKGSWGLLCGWLGFGYLAVRVPGVL
nr:reverse transcriptase domain-containing protein [Tanacetum cinerariifolium]